MDKSWMIDKVLSGKASEREKDELNTWIATDPEIKNDYEDMKLLWDNARRIGDIDHDDSFYDGLRKIEKKINLLRKKGTKIKFYKTMSMIAVLAAIVFTISTALKKHVARTTGYDHAIDSPYTDNLRFDDATLEKILKTLETKYGIVVEIKDKELLHCRFTGTFYQDVTPDDILYTLAQAMDLEYKMLDSKKYTLKGKGCRGFLNQRIPESFLFFVHRPVDRREGALI